MKLEGFEDVIGKQARLKIMGEGAMSHPWQGKEVTAIITAEYDEFFVGEMIPHRAMFGPSWPYVVCVNKRDVIAGDMRMRLCK